MIDIIELIKEVQLMNNNNLTYAFDIGITSTGVAVSDGNHIKYMGSHVFNEAKEAKDPRKNRSARRKLAQKTVN